MTSIAWLVAGGLLTGAMYFTASKASSGKNTWSDRDVVSFVPLVLIWIISTIWHGISTHSWAMLFAQILTLLGTLVVLTTVSKGVLEKLYCHLQGLKYSDQAVLKQYKDINRLLPRHNPTRAQVHKVVTVTLPDLEQRIKLVDGRIDRISKIIQSTAPGIHADRQLRARGSLRGIRAELQNRLMECLGFLGTVEALLLSAVDGDLPDVSEDFERLMQSMEADRAQKQEALQEVSSLDRTQLRAAEHA
ncbi:hypothetical protein CO174_00100 [Candidatus Uhrbacteria bacterium CG_4_9_14_3_um_filter_50_9]|uniref:Uncharacterized protein n=1 Tax=Candidatus Uhrbacteria bacterium CG_4_9_14_3_um_filter_50_9 TaxID=1975035 RepID=A0A2M7XEX4_9BACT|nr:MAG: hypothetical protein CO174_00100 [Candidatus Uhrbacteria bacterium CG_4_9_14_3_um_filter_50_9]